MLHPAAVVVLLIAPRSHVPWPVRPRPPQPPCCTPAPRSLIKLFQYLQTARRRTEEFLSCDTGTVVENPLSMLPSLARKMPTPLPTESLRENQEMPPPPPAAAALLGFPASTNQTHEIYYSQEERVFSVSGGRRGAACPLSHSLLLSRGHLAVRRYVFLASVVSG